ncbi:MAG: hypothetical protein J07HB67_00423, partial [halophilic archaeon J07HB67]
ERLETVADSVADAETEADLDDAETDLDTIADKLDAATLQADDEEDPAAALEDHLETVRDDLTAARGPYAADVTETVESVGSTLRDTRWTVDGEAALAGAQTTFVETVADTLDTEIDAATDGGGESLADGLDAVTAAVGDAGLDPDDDAETIQTLLTAAETFADACEAAEEWDDLEVREQLEAEGFYDVLGHYKDFPPELAAVKAWADRGNVEMVLLALDKLGSEFMEDHCLDALTRMNDDDAFEAMESRAQRRDQAAIEALGEDGRRGGRRDARRLRRRGVEPTAPDGDVQSVGRDRSPGRRPTAREPARRGRRRGSGACRPCTRVDRRHPCRRPVGGDARDRRGRHRPCGGRLGA